MTSLNHTKETLQTGYEITYFRLMPTHPPPAPRPRLIPLPPDPYTRVHVPNSNSWEPTPRDGTCTRQRHEKATGVNLPKAKRVHFAENRNTVNSPTGSPTLDAPPPPPPKSIRPSAFSKPRSCTPPATDLHLILTTFPAYLWDMRRRATPRYDPCHSSHFSEPVFPSDLGRLTIKLVFMPCSRTELSWFAIATPCGTHLVVGDVLRTISTELFRRSACRELYADHPCYSKANFARQLRALGGPWYGTAGHQEDCIRNVDLYHIDMGQALWFRGLQEERLRDGETVFRVLFSYA